jgi:ABC-2 type transport system permease protein
MNLGRALVIARANLVRLLRDRLGLFFILVLPMIIILVTGLQFGGGFQARVGLLAPDGGAMADALATTLERDWNVVRYEAAADLERAVTEGSVAAGVTLPEGYTDRLVAGEPVQVEFRAAGGDVAIGRRNIVASALAEQAALVRAATFAAAETGASTDTMIAAAEEAREALPPIEVDVTTVGESLFPEELAGFALGAQSQLVLFIFLTSLTGAAQLILSRTLGVSRRMLSTSTPMPTILLGEALGRFAVGLFQGLFIVAATALIFGVAWGDPLGAGALVIAFSLVSAGVAMLIGAVADNAEQASSVGVFAGLGIGALGGSMVPPEIFPPVMQTISWFTPHRWTLDGFRELIAGGSIVDVLPQLGVLAAFAVVLLGLATWRLRAALSR